MTQAKSIKERRCPVANCQRPEEAAKVAVKHVFEILGVDVDDPKQVEDFREDLRFSGGMRDMTRKGKIAMMVSFIGLVTTAIWISLFGK